MKAIAELGTLLARSAVLAETLQRDAANDLLSRARQEVGSLSDEEARQVHGLMSDWISDEMEAGAVELAPAADLLRAATGAGAAVQRTTIADFITTLAADF